MSDLNTVPQVPQDASVVAAQPIAPGVATPTTPVPDAAPVIPQSPTASSTASTSEAAPTPEAIPSTPQIANEEPLTASKDEAASTTARIPAVPDAASATPGAPNATPEPTPKARIFKIGATRIVADASTAQLSQEEVRAFLKPTYPEVANAAIRETNVDENTLLLEFLAQPGRKG